MFNTQYPAPINIEGKIVEIGEDIATNLPGV